MVAGRGWTRFARTLTICAYVQLEPARVPNSFRHRLQVVREESVSIITTVTPVLSPSKRRANDGRDSIQSSRSEDKRGSTAASIPMARSGDIHKKIR